MSLEADKSLVQIVGDILVKSPNSRQDDRRLILNVWCQQLGITKSQIETMPFKAVSDAFLQKKIAMPDSVTRIRRLYQSHYPPTSRVWSQTTKQEAEKASVEAVREMEKIIAGNQLGLGEQESE